MKNFILYLLLLICAGEVVTLSLMNGPKNKDTVLGETVVQTPVPITSSSFTSSPTPTPTPLPTKSLTPTPTPTPTPIPQPTTSSQEINGFIDRFSAQYGVDPNVIRHLAICESGFRSNAVNGIYVGLFQFNATTWKNIRKEFGEDVNPDLRYSAEESVQTACYALSKGKVRIWPNCQP